jgi:exosortase C (VPDSG-CTERM-specific)
MHTPEPGEIATGVRRASAPITGAIGRDPNAMRQLKRLGLAVIIVAICFAAPLYRLFRFALDSDLYSYILLIPAISIYLVWIKKESIQTSAPVVGLGAFFAVVGTALLAVHWLVIRSDGSLTNADRLVMITLSFVFFVFSACAVFLGRSGFRSMAFPILFLLFIVPLPSPAENAIESFLQHGSAEAAYLLLNISGTPVLRENMLFVLPGIRLEVAPECSGIRSTFVLILSSLIAGHFFLRQIWTKSILVVAIVLLGIFRNAIRIFTLAQLCIHISPSMIDSPLHHRGGPVFFAISLVPFLFLIWYLRKIERRRAKLNQSSGH